MNTTNTEKMNYLLSILTLGVLLNSMTMAVNLIPVTFW